MDSLIWFFCLRPDYPELMHPRSQGPRVETQDRRRHAATYASGSGVPIEIVSKVILRHANLSTTRRYLGLDYFNQKFSNVQKVRHKCFPIHPSR